MDSIKNYQRYLVDNGLLFEINRKVLHPLGLSLVIDRDFKSKKKLQIIGLYETHELEGFLFPQESFDLGKENFDKFLTKRRIRLKTREENLGFIEQEEGKDG